MGDLSGIFFGLVTYCWYVCEMFFSSHLHFIGVWGLMEFSLDDLVAKSLEKLEKDRVVNGS